MIGFQDMLLTVAVTVYLIVTALVSVIAFRLAVHQMRTVPAFLVAVAAGAIWPGILIYLLATMKYKKERS